LSGDGSAGFNLSEISTALRFGNALCRGHRTRWRGGASVADGQTEGRRIASQFGKSASIAWHRR